MIFRDFNGIPLKENETIQEEAKISKIGLLIAWLSIPAVLLLFFLFTYMPYLVRMALSQSFRNALMAQYEVDLFSELDLSKVLFGLVFEKVPNVLIVLLCIPLVLLVIAWLGLCLYKTSRYFGYSLALTDLRIIGKAAQETLDAPFNEIVNVFMERSLVGKIFNYGNIVVSTKRKSLTFKNIHDPKRMYSFIMSYAENYAAH